MDIQNITRSVLAVIAIVILALALSLTPTGAKLVQGGLIVAIIVVLFRNEPAVQDTFRGLTGMVTQQPSKQTGT